MIITNIPSSKSLAQRAIFLASMGPGGSINSIPYCDDVIALIEGIKSIRYGAQKKCIYSSEVNFDSFSDPLVGGVKVSARLGGLPARLLIAASTCASKSVIVTGNKPLLLRPMDSVVEAIKSFSVDVSYLKSKHNLPIRIEKNNKKKSYEIDIPSSHTSQSSTAILLLCAVSKKSYKINIKKPIYSKSYLQMTLDLISNFGGHVTKFEDQSSISISIKPITCKINITIPGDASSGVFLIAASVLTKSKIRINNWFPNGMQPDEKLIELFKKWGVIFHTDSFGLTVDPVKCLPDKVIDCELFPDGAIALAAVAANCNYEIILKGLDTWKYKESNRLETVKELLKSLGVAVSINESEMSINGPIKSRADIHTHDDHRVAFLGGILSLRYPGINIKNPNVVTKSWPNFWNQLDNFKRTVKHIGIV